MTLYNVVLATGSFTNASFLQARGGMWVEYVIILLCVCFLSSPATKRLAFRVVQPGDRPIAIILTIQVFTVVYQVALASIIGVYHGYGITGQLVPNYLVTYCRNFVMALPVQLLIAGPIARWLFRSLFRRKKAAAQEAYLHDKSTAWGFPDGVFMVTAPWPRTEDSDPRRTADGSGRAAGPRPVG